jgi:leader peptidase (prepilin peptidase)/N-methyltransferase
VPAELPPLAALAAAAVLGPVFGSFVTALSYRVPRGESIAAGRSRCPACGHALGVADLVPIASWLARRGRCRYCGVAVPPRYPIIEALSLALFVATAALVRDPVRLALLVAFVPTALALAVTDFEHQRLPNGLIAALAPVALAWRWYGGAGPGTGLNAGLGQGLVAAALVYGALLALDGLLVWRRGESGLGGGDAKLIVLAALSLPWLPFFVFLALAGALGLGLGLWWRSRTGQERFPFGIAILLAWWLSLAVPLTRLFPEAS